jgi:lipoprotein NlpD
MKYSSAMLKNIVYLNVLNVLLLSACSSVNLNPAPVVDRNDTGVVLQPVPVAVNPATTDSPSQQDKPTQATLPPLSYPVSRPVISPLPTVSTLPNDGKTHVVRKDDTLYSIALENGLSYRELADWNGIADPSYIQLDQVLRLTPPNVAVDDASLKPGSTRPNGAVIANNPVARSLPVSLPNMQASPATAPLSVALPKPVAVIAKPEPIAQTSNLAWQWPVSGRIIAPYTDTRKGIDFAGVMGDPVFAAADGRVVYSGSALKGYGKMLIVKHNDVYLTAYAHNSKLLVKEDALVKRGQKIAEMGNTESEGGKVKMHFEIRRSGKPVDPTKILPTR